MSQPYVHIYHLHMEDFESDLFTYANALVYEYEWSEDHSHNRWIQNIRICQQCDVMVKVQDSQSEGCRFESPTLLSPISGAAL